MKPNTMGSVMASIRNAKTKEECLAAYEAYKAQCPDVAEENIRFGISYNCEGSEQARLMLWIFGVCIACEPSKADLREIIQAKDAEIKRLRDALEKIAEVYVSYDTAEETAMDAKVTARAALSNTDENQ